MVPPPGPPGTGTIGSGSSAPLSGGITTTRRLSLRPLGSERFSRTWIVAHFGFSESSPGTWHGVGDWGLGVGEPPPTRSPQTHAPNHHTPPNQLSSQPSTQNTPSSYPGSP